LFPKIRVFRRPHLVCYSVVPGAVSLEGKRPGRVPDHSRKSFAEVKITWSHTFLHPLVHIYGILLNYHRGQQTALFPGAKKYWYTTCTGDRNIEREGGLSGSLEDAVHPFTLGQDASCDIEKLQLFLQVFRRIYF